MVYDDARLATRSNDNCMATDGTIENIIRVLDRSSSYLELWNVLSCFLTLCQATITTIHSQVRLSSFHHVFVSYLILLHDFSRVIVKETKWLNSSLVYPGRSVHSYPNLREFFRIIPKFSSNIKFDKTANPKFRTMQRVQERIMLRLKKSQNELKDTKSIRTRRSH